MPTARPKTSFAGVHHVLRSAGLPNNPSQEEMNLLVLWDLTELRDNLQLEYNAQLARVAPRPLSPRFVRLLRDLFRKIEVALEDDDG
ncbi:hypothetical protein BO79DRAFT_135157 [Aspergillus costaricaensis CBS 115574]|uniref:Uncharacterized protein n=1 Tax=Aspergillus costaricaensis CBS 115574 TaxID=1448317 RepID=A0ACD1IVE1_9EURO|nr:hypothetical protein BO79DRAFT_135157 [Aspergillus costaricaensis CBS 115574]RAK94607.1 hypothetical protein BO79DRAFT_135157 [Aspergillus costaricaensis CBS 115574]